MAKANKTKNDDKVLLYENTGKKGKKTLISEMVKLSNPVTETARKIMALLSYDSRVLTEFDFNKHTLWVYVSDPDVCEAYKFFLRRKYDLGGLTLDVKLIATYQGDAEEVGEATYKVTDDEKLRLFKLLFKDGLEPRYQSAVDQYNTRWDFFEFPPMALTYQADDLQNIKGFKSVLLTDAVKETFDVGFYRISSLAF